MSSPQRLFRILAFCNASFVGVAVLITAVVGLGILRGLEQESRQAYRQLIGAEFQKSYSQIAEEAYLGLGSIELHEQVLSKILLNKGRLTLRLLQTSKRQQIPTEPNVQVRWESHSSIDNFAVPILFGDILVGSLDGTIDWDSVLSVRTIVIRVSLLLLVLIGGSFLLWAVIRKRVIAPLLYEFAEGEQARAVASTTHMLAHDIRQPLASFRMLLEAFKSPSDLGDGRKVIGDAIPRLETIILRINGVLKDIMEMGRPALDSFESVDPGELVGNAMKEAVGPASLMRVHKELKHSLRIRADKDRLLRVLHNLIENAVEANDGAGDVWITTSDEKKGGEGVVRIGVRNAGPVISKSDLEAVFSPYFTKGKKTGTGLGLAVAKKIVSLHNGEIGCLSTAEQGTEFFFTVPAFSMGTH